MWQHVVLFRSHVARIAPDRCNPSDAKVRPGRAADHSPPSSAAVMEEYSYTSTHPLGHTGPVTGSLYLSTTLHFWDSRNFELTY